MDDWAPPVSDDDDDDIQITVHRDGCTPPVSDDDDDDVQIAVYSGAEKCYFEFHTAEIFPQNARGFDARLRSVVDDIATNLRSEINRSRDIIMEKPFGEQAIDFVFKGTIRVFPPPPQIIGTNEPKEPKEPNEPMQPKRPKRPQARVGSKELDSLVKDTTKLAERDRRTAHLMGRHS